MTRHACVVALAAAGAVVVAACATTGAREATNIVIAPYESARECFDVAAGERLDYRFSSDTPLDFEVVSHDGAAEVASIANSGVTEDARIFAPLLPRRYCAVWLAGRAGATMSYTIALKPPP